MYDKASLFSLALAMLVRDQVLSLLMISELKFLKKNGQNQDEATASSCLMLATALLRADTIVTSLSKVHL